MTEHIGFAVDEYGASVSALAHDVLERLSRFLLFAIEIDQLGQYLMYGITAVSDRRVKIVHGRKGIPAHDDVQPFGLEQRSEGVAQTLGFLFQHVLALADILFLHLLFEPCPYLGTRLRRLYDAQPVAAGSFGAVGGDYLDVVARCELGLQRNYAVVYLCAHAVVAYLTVYAVRKVDGSGAFRQYHHVAFGREYKDLTFVKVHFERLIKFLRVSCLALSVHDPAQPFELVVARVVHGVGHVLLVLPVRGYAVFGDTVHFVRANRMECRSWS